MRRGRSRPPTLLFYSRRIGLEDGHAVPVVAGGRVTGRSGPFQIGVLQTVTESAMFRDEETEDRYQTDAGEFLDDEDPRLETATIMDTVEVDFIDTTNVRRTHFSVIRLKRDLPSRSSVGFIVVNRDPGLESSYNRSFGVDADVSLLDAALSLRGFAALSFSPDRDGRESAGQLEIDYRKGVFESRAAYLDVGEDFNPEVGFVPREGMRRFRTHFRYRPLPATSWIRRYSIGPSFTYVTDLNNRLQTRDVSVAAFVNLETGDWVGLRFRERFERLDEPFEIHDDIDVPAGTHRFGAYSLEVFSDKGRKFYSNGVIELSDFWTGSRVRLSIDGTANINTRFSVSSDYEFNRVCLPEGNFETNAMSNRLLYTFSTDMFARGLVQWNSNREIVGFNGLWNWRYLPGSDLFLVYSQVWDTEGDGQLHRSLQFKAIFWQQ